MKKIILAALVLCGTISLSGCIFPPGGPGGDHGHGPGGGHFQGPHPR